MKIEQRIAYRKRQRNKRKYEQLKNTLAIVVGTVLAVLLICIMVIIKKPRQTYYTTENITIKNGDTLWNIASEIETTEPLQQVIWDIKNINNLDGHIKAGQVLTIPIYVDNLGKVTTKISYEKVE